MPSRTSRPECPEGHKMSRATTVLQGPTAGQIMIKRVKLHSLEVRNYLGAGNQCLRLQLDGNHAVLCGPNGSGKTTLLSALDHLRRVNWTAALQSWSQGHNPSQVTLWD